MVTRKIMTTSLLLLSICHSNSICVATSSSLVDDLNKEMEKAGFSTPVVDAAPENQPLISKYTTNIQAFINANQEVIVEASWINKIPSLLSNVSRNQLHHNLYRAYNSLILVFDALEFKSPKIYFEDIKKSFEETKQTLNDKQSRIATLEGELTTLQSNASLKDQQIESLGNSIKSLIQMINPVMFSDSNSLTEEQKNQEFIQSMDKICLYLKQDYPALIPPS